MGNTGQYPPGTWSRVDDGIVSGRVLQATTPCDVCGVPGCVVQVSAYQGIEAEWRSTIIWLDRPAHIPQFAIPAAVKVKRPEVAVFLGISCGCLQKLHRQVAHIRDKKEARNRRSDPTGAWK